MSTVTLIYISIVLVTLYDVADFCKVSNLPEFQATELELVTPVEDDRVSVLVPSYTFTCAGNVTEWRARVSGRRNAYDRYDLTFSIWRRKEMNNNCTFENIGRNFHTGLAPEVDTDNTPLGTLTFDVPEDKRVLVQPGDFIGIDVQYRVTSPDILPIPGSILMYTNQTDAMVYIKSYSLHSTSCINELYERVDEVNSHHQLSAVAAAPIITMEIGERCLYRQAT